MKPILIAVALLASTFTKSFASDGPTVEPTVLKSFKTTFANATEVDWSTTQDLYKAVFSLNGQYVTAYFKEDGTMQALVRHINTTNLPIILQTALKNNYKGQWVSDVLEVTSDGSLHYYVTLENADTKTILKSSVTTWSNYQKQHKD
jgi:hypothetical protein